MLGDEAEELRQLEGDAAFKAGMNALIQQVEDFYRDRTFTEIISFAWPRVEKSRLANQIRNPLTGLEFPPLPLIRWRGADNLGLPIEDLLPRVRAVLRSGDPFITAFENLMEQLDREFSASLSLRLLRCRDPLTESEREALRNLFTTDPEQLKDLFDDLDDRTVLDSLYQDWLSQEPISFPLDPLPSGFDRLVDFPEPSECTLIWRGSVSLEEREAVLNLPGDNSFRRAIDELTRLRPDTAQLPDLLRAQLQIGTDILTWTFPAPTDEQLRALRNLAGDNDFRNSVRRLINAIAEAESDLTEISVPLTPLPDLRQASATLGLDRIPKSLTNQIRFSTDGGNYTQLNWTGSLLNEQEQDLIRWAQIPTFQNAVNNLIQALETRSPISQELPAEVPSAIGAQLQINPNELAWVGSPPNAEQQNALQALRDDAERDQELRDAVSRLLDALATDSGQSLVVVVSATNLPHRPTEADLPDVLRDRLTMTSTQVTWQGRLQQAEQLQALQALGGDAIFRRALTHIVGELTQQPIENSFSEPIPIRPQTATLPDILRDKLLIGQAVIRYHGLMTVEEGQTLQSQYETQPDRDAIQRLYNASINRGLQGRELRIRTRRGSAAPSALNALTPRLL